MIYFKYFLERLKDVKIRDYASVIPMTIALIAKPFFKRKYQKIWLVCEEPAEARDNGYHFYKYMCKKQPQQRCVYAIRRKSVDYQKVKNLGSVIEYGSIKHWLVYFLCEYNISSQKGGKPNAAICSFMELSGGFKPQNVFLQHGITKDMASWLYADKCFFKYFITAALPEHEMIKKYYGYSEGTVQLTGFPRYDALNNSKTDYRQVLIMPTWRYWFNLKSKRGKDVNTDFSRSDYLNKWLELLNSQFLNTVINEYDLKIIFFLHRNMQKYIDSFEHVNSKITIASWKSYDIQELLKQSALMITDYSSVFFDMMYMKKPIIFYQFDETEYRKYQYQQGWFDYHNNAFGKTYDSSKNVIHELREYAAANFKIGDDYEKAYGTIFKYSDTNNSKRVFEVLKRF